MTVTFTKRHAIYAAAAVLFLFWFSAPARGPFSPAPFIPSPFSPQPDRPVLRVIARLAKTFLWVALVADGPPAEAAEYQTVRARVGDDGHQVLEHGRGW
jgi:hypothetical protein